MPPDYSLYLVTDSTDAILQGRDLASIVRDAISGGVTIVQYRDKKSDTRDLISTARKLHHVTKAAGVPLLINDRVDVALAVGAEGVHIGQDDMDLTTARALFGPAAIIGVTCHNSEHALKAVQDGADYLGIGTLFSTATKPDAKDIIGIAGCKNILEALSASDADRSGIATVAIGGINRTNLQRVLYQSAATSKSLDGVAVVSAIMAAEDPTEAARSLKELSQSPPPFISQIQDQALVKHSRDVLAKVPSLTKKLLHTGPLCHNMTNLVVQNFAANIVLAVGAKPIMSNDGGEAEDLASLGGALVINMGTCNSETIKNYLKALSEYNKRGGPVLFDPVGAGATKLRRSAVKTLLAGGYFDAIKGNESEIQVVLGSSKQQRGVDSSSDLDDRDKASLVKTLALRERNVVIMTGKVDFVSDGHRTFKIHNGVSFLGEVTGTGCTLGATIASYMAVFTEDKLLAAIAGILHFEIAAERAKKQPSVNGPGTFVPAFIDCLSEIKYLSADDDHSWLNDAKLEALDV